MHFFKTILARFFSLFGKKKIETPLSNAMQVQTSLEDRVDGIALHVDLVDTLQDDHKELLNMYTDVLNDAQSNKLQDISNKLKKFKDDFGSHLNTENTKFYGYLEQQLEPNSSESKEMRSFRRNMRNIETNVNKFLNYWIDNGVTQESLHTFLEESGQIGDALVQRISEEEQKLYPIYAFKIAESKQAA